MTRIQTFHEDSDAASLRSRHHRQAWAIASRMSQTNQREACGREPDSSSQHVSLAGLSSPEICTGCCCCCCSLISNLRSGSVSPFQSLDHSGVDGPCASEVCSPKEAVGATSVAGDCYDFRSPSPCLYLDTLSSDGSAGPGDISDHPICISDVSSHSGHPEQVLSDDELTPEVRVVDLPPEVRMIDLQLEVRIIDLPPEVRIVNLPPKVRTVDLMLEVRVVDLPPEGRVDAVPTVTPPGSAWMSPCSPPVVSLDQSAVSSMAISPNRVRLVASPDLPDAEPVFEVSPDTSGFLMRPSGAAVQAPESCLPPQPGPDTYCELMLGEPVAFTLSGPIPGSDAPPMTFPVYPLPSGLHFCPGSLLCRRFWHRQFLRGRLDGPPVCQGLMTFPDLAAQTGYESLPGRNQPLRETVQTVHACIAGRSRHRSGIARTYLRMP